jgi:hypothetical protein
MNERKGVCLNAMSGEATEIAIARTEASARPPIGVGMEARVQADP